MGRALERSGAAPGATPHVAGRPRPQEHGCLGRSGPPATARAVPRSSSPGGSVRFQTVGAVLAISVLASWSGLAAQAALDPRLQAAVTLAQTGRADSARGLVRRLLTTLP